MAALPLSARTPNPPDGIWLDDFFARAYAPQRLKPDARHECATYTESVAWLHRYLNRRPAVADLLPEALLGVHALIVEHGFTATRASAIKKRLSMMAKHAWHLGFLAEWRRVHAHAKTTQRSFLEGPIGPDTLLATFEQRMRPKLIGKRSQNRLNTIARAIDYFDRFLGRHATADDVANQSTLARFHEFRVVHRGRSESAFHDLRCALITVARELEPARFPKPIRGRKKPPLPEPEPGTARHFYETVYRPQCLLGKSASHKRDMLRTLRALFDFHGRDVRLDELSDALAAAFFEWIIARGHRLETVNGHRRRLFALWRIARERGLIAHDPHVRTFKAPTDAADAWSEAELAALLDACGRIRWRSDVAGVPAADYWRAYLLVGYWTALRCGTLRSLLWSDVNLTSGWITVRGTEIKNKTGQLWRIGPDAIAALQAIWLPTRELVFPWTLRDGTFFDHFKRIIKTAGVAPSKRVSFTLTHKLRRTTATLTARDRGMTAANELLGHSSLQLTKRYIDVSKLPGRDATEFLPTIAPAPLPVSAQPVQRTSREALKDADALLGNDPTAAAFTVRVALERWLYELNERHRGKQSFGSLKAVADSLHSRQLLSDGARILVRTIADGGNAAAHGKKVSSVKAATLIQQLRDLFATTGADE